MTAQIISFPQPQRPVGLSADDVVAQALWDALCAANRQLSDEWPNPTDETLLMFVAARRAFRKAFTGSDQ